MTTITTPPANVPDITDPANFATYSAAWVAWQKIAFPEVSLVAGEINAAVGSVNTNIAAINTVSTNITDVVNVSDNMASILAAIAGGVVPDVDGNVTLSEELLATCYLEKVVALSGTTPTVDCDEGNVFTLTTSGNTTFTFSYAGVDLTTDEAYGFTLRITAGGTHALTWPGSVDWPGGASPDAPASGETDVYVFWTSDGGATWFGVRSMDALS